MDDEGKMAHCLSIQIGRKSYVIMKGCLYMNYNIITDIYDFNEFRQWVLQGEIPNFNIITFLHKNVLLYIVLKGRWSMLNV